MNLKEIKAELKRAGLDRRELAKEVGSSYSYLSARLNGFAPMSEGLQSYIEKKIRDAIGGRIENR